MIWGMKGMLLATCQNNKNKKRNIMGSSYILTLTLPLAAHMEQKSLGQELYLGSFLWEVVHVCDSHYMA